jgi:hypothetical protein
MGIQETLLFRGIVYISLYVKHVKYEPNDNFISVDKDDSDNII